MCEFVNDICVICGIPGPATTMRLRNQQALDRQMKAIRRTAELGLLIFKAVGLTLEKEIDKNLKVFAGVS